MSRWLATPGTVSLAALLASAGLAANVHADIQFVITTDSDLNDNGSVDEFVPIPADGVARTVSIWGISRPTVDDIFEFNFDLANSGSGLSFSNATIGSTFAMGITDTNLGDLQFGWSAFLWPAVSIPATAYTLFATVDVAIAPGAMPGADTTIDLAGADFKVCADANSCSAGVQIPTTGTSRDLTVSECQIEAPLPEPGGTWKNRYASFAPAGWGRPTALRFKLTSLPPPFDPHDGLTLWVGPPEEVTESSGDSDPSESPESPVFAAATLQCESYYGDWGVFPVIHVYHAGFVPGGTYQVQAIADGCDEDLEESYSEPFPTTTSLWGDIVADCMGIPCGPPDGDADFDDISSLVDKFRNLPGAPIKARADIAPDTPDQCVDFLDIPWAVDAFRGLPYPFDGPNECP